MWCQAKWCMLVDLKYVKEEQLCPSIFGENILTLIKSQLVHCIERRMALNMLHICFQKWKQNNTSQTYWFIDSFKIYLKSNISWFMFFAHGCCMSQTYMIHI